MSFVEIAPPRRRDIYVVIGIIISYEGSAPYREFLCFPALASTYTRAII